ncbi:hypothetical protein [Aporhodopirellula aestuarii]|uniref:Uncharacterized protein n=1 Tax=Aporhodopirellula aestuarii TaxID=2950107 RepID=A0ABT0UB74_9BACT|nr:hypothetical protein [Aporhodopirellula aestuarii]MCM2374163.1 hypothetical protein [Aporhodopirellula aestuarii]
MQMPSKPSLAISLRSISLLCFLCTFVACGPSGITLSGTVAVDGTPVEKGKISLVPKPGVDSPTAMAPIIAGQFTVPPTSNLRTGQFDVRVSITNDHPKPAELTFVGSGDKGAVGAAMAKAMKDAPPPEENFTTELVVEGSHDDLQVSFSRNAAG